VDVAVTGCVLEPIPVLLTVGLRTTPEDRLIGDVGSGSAVEGVAWAGALEVATGEDNVLAKSGSWGVGDVTRCGRWRQQRTNATQRPTRVSRLRVTAIVARNMPSPMQAREVQKPRRRQRRQSARMPVIAIAS
jgi:hypothetical protein